MILKKRFHNIDGVNLFYQEGTVGLKFRCQSCGADIYTPDKKAGETVQCPNCANYNVVPSSAFEYSEAPAGAVAASEGIKRFSPKSFGDIFEETFKIYSQNLGPIVGISALGTIPVMIFTFIIMVPMFLAAGINGGESELGLAASFIMAIFIAAVTLLVYSVMYGALVFSIGWRYLDRTVGVFHAYKMAFKRVFPLIGASLLVPIICGILAITIIGIPFAIFLGVSWMFYYQIVIFEMKSPVEAMRKSYELVKGDWWLALGVGLTFGIITGAVTMMLSFIPIIGSFAAVLFVIPIQLVAVSVFYFERRGRKENYTTLNLEQEITSLEMSEG